MQIAQKKLGAEIGTIRSSLIIDTCRGGSQIICNTGQGDKVTAWVWARSGESLNPVIGMPLVLFDEKNNMLAQAISGPSGRTDFNISNLQNGQYRVAVNPQAGTMALLEKMFADLFTKVENRLSLSLAGLDLQGATKGAIMNLFGGAALAPLSVQKVTMGPVTYGDSKLGSSFAHALQQVIRQHLTDIDGLIVVEPRKRDAQMVTEVINTRGIDLKNTDSITILGTPAMQAAIDGADAALEVSYTVQGREIWIDMNLKEAATDILKGAATAIVAKNMIPYGLEVVPQGLTQSTTPPPKMAGAIRLDVSSHLGDGQTYQEGDVISYFANTDRDAYLLFIYEDAEHNLIQILPNKFSGNGLYPAGDYFEVPGARDKFQFVIQGPFGLERLWAFAATQKLPQLHGRELENGLILLSDSMTDVLQRLRTFGGTPGVAYGEAQAIITTMGKRGSGAAF
ncbi:MAG: DUF4384 domain-containing protein [Proteobacteria bacterium]|nr:DUF4384 domain-containing protein [Pseudomonadota bacterium]